MLGSGAVQMLVSFFSWWFTRIIELLPASWTGAGEGPIDGIVVDSNQMYPLVVSVRQKGLERPLSLGAAARIAPRKTVVLRPPPDAVLEKQHVVPTAPRRELNQLLRYELARITPFTAEDLFWRWDGRPKAGDKSRTVVTLTMVPKAAVATALDALTKAGLQPRLIETGAAERPRMLAINDEANRSAHQVLTRGLSWTCAGLAITAVALPVLLQELALRRTDAAIDALQPTIRHVEALRRGITADGAGRDVLAKEMQRTGDVLQVLAAVTRILPDDTFLTDFSLRDRQMTLGGRSAAAARLITSLSADPLVRDAAFAAPVTRLEGATTDLFSIRAGIAP
jgi:general secretion pathway protein L